MCILMVSVLRDSVRNTSGWVRSRFAPYLLVRPDWLLNQSFYNDRYDMGRRCTQYIMHECFDQWDEGSSSKWNSKDMRWQMSHANEDGIEMTNKLLTLRNSSVVLWYTHCNPRYICEYENARGRPRAQLSAPSCSLQFSARAAVKTSCFILWSSDRTENAFTIHPSSFR